MIKKYSASFVQMLPLLLGTYFTIVIDETVTTLSLPQIQKDIFGYRRCLQMFFLIACVTQLSTYFLRNFIVMLVFRFVTGIAYSGANSTRNALVMQLPAKQSTEKYVFNTTIINSFLSIILPIMGSSIVTYGNWRIIYLVASSCSFLMFLSCFMYENFKLELIEGKSENEENNMLLEVEQKQYKFDIWGMIVIAVAMATFCLSFTLMSNKQYMYFGISFGVSIVSFVGLYFVEKHAVCPILPALIFKRPTALVLYLNGQLFFLTTAFNWLVPQILNKQNRNSMFAGIMTGIQALFCMMAAVITPQIRKKVTSRLIILVSFVFVLIGFAVMCIIMKNSYALAATYILTFYFFGVQIQLLYVFMMLAVPPELSSTMAGMPTCSRTIGQSISLCLYSAIQSIVEKNVGFYFSYQVVLIIMSVFAIFGLFLSWLLGTPKKEEGLIGSGKHIE
ncbi:Major_facilitator superfamily protein [Hexamita inflata]|uniref:Major facilitator superfamily protein n=1 Tax=Hexamita inflata TaxID=28002 RepID=A0AA86PQ31_9EUKA|nr:Major facilitator superfamily protein [Hexamita inflata]